MNTLSIHGRDHDLSQLFVEPPALLGGAVRPPVLGLMGAELGQPQRPALADPVVDRLQSEDPFLRLGRIASSSSETAPPLCSAGETR